MNTQIVRTRTPTELALSEAFRLHAGRLPGGDAVVRVRESAFTDFDRFGLPNRRIEAWHYTDLRAAMTDALPLAEPPDAAAIATFRAKLDHEPLLAHRIVVLDGCFVAELSTPVPPGVTLRALADVLRDGDSAWTKLIADGERGRGDIALALNAAFMSDGVVLDVAPGTVLDTPLNIVCGSIAEKPTARFTRSIVRLGEGARARVVEWTLEDAAVRRQAFNCLMIYVGDDAVLDHATFMPEMAEGSIHFEAFVAIAGARAQVASVAGVFGGGLVRRHIDLRLRGDHASARFDGVALLSGRAHADTTMFIDHRGLACESRETFRYVLADRSTGVFQGKIRVAPEAQKTDGKMMSRALLLSDDATMNNKPELEIFADDVACGHGATCGGLNEEQLFYLQARGLPRPDAESLLLEGFAGEAADAIDDPDLTARFRAEIARWLVERSAS